MGKKKLLFALFIFVLLGIIGYGSYYALSNITSESYNFSKDGYALYVSESNQYKEKSLSFSKGTEYDFKKLNDNITFTTKDGSTAKIDDTTVIHYADNSIMVLKDTVGIDLNTIANNIIFYYNIYKNTTIEYGSGEYSITTYNNDKITFGNVLIRVSDNKYLFLGNNIRATISKDEVIDFGNYVYFEYRDNSVVGIYNNSKSYQNISRDLSIVCDDLIINLYDKSIAKDGKKYITLSNLVINNDANIDIITEENVLSLPEISTSKVDVSENSGDTGTIGGNVVNTDEEEKDEEAQSEEEEIVDDSNTAPTYKVSEMKVTPITFDAQIDVNDTKGLITTDTEITIVNNANLKTVFESTAPRGDTTILVSSADLEPDTEYTLYAKAKYVLKEVEYEKSFVSKIFRTQSLGVSFSKSYATSSSIAVLVEKENYSNVSSVTINILNTKGEKLDYRTVNLEGASREEILFEGLDNNTEYTIVMNEITCDNVSVKDGYSETITLMTLKKAPVIGKLNYAIDKKNGLFELSADKITDSDSGIKEYRYEVYDARNDMDKDEPNLIVKSSDANKVKAIIDEVKLSRGISYTYKLVLVFYDNEKTIEYSKELGTTMQMDGVNYPTLRFESTYVTWEQINGSIIIDDEYNTIVGDTYRVVYKNSVDTYKVNKIVASTSEDIIPISVNNLRANETYTFQVYADINLKDGNETIDEAYIGSVIVQTTSPKALTATYTDTGEYSSAFGFKLKLNDTNNIDSKLEASTISEMTITLYQGASTNGAKEIYKKVVDTNDDDYISTIKAAFYDASTNINPKFFNSSNSDYKEKTYTLEISKVYDYTDYKNEIEIKNNTYTFSINGYVPDVPDDPDNAIIVTPIKNSAAESCGMEYNDDLIPNTTVCYELKSNYMNTAKNAKRIVYHTWVYNQLAGEYQMIPSLDKVVTYDINGNVSPAIMQIGNGTSTSVFDSDMIRRGNNYYFSYEVYLDMDEDGTEDSVYPTVVDSTVTLKSRNVSLSKQSPVYSMYPSISTSTSATWKYKINDIDNALLSNNLYGYVGNNTNPASSPSISISNNYQSVIFTKLSSKNFYTIKSKEKLNKNSTETTNTLSVQYLYKIISPLNINYSTSVESNRLVISIDNYYTEEVTNSVDSIVSATVNVSATGVATKTFENLFFEDGNIYINLIDLADFINKQMTVTLTVSYDSGNAGFDVTSSYKALQKVSLDGMGNYYSLNTQNKLVQNSTIKSSEFNTTFDPLNKLLSITDKSSRLLNLNVDIDESGVIYDVSNIVLKELSSQVVTPSNNDAIFHMLIPSISLRKNGKLNVTSLLNSADITAKLTVSGSTTVKENLIYMDLYQTDKNGTNSVLLNTYSYTIQSFNNPISLSGLNPQNNYAVKFYAYIYDTTTSTYDKYYLYDEDDKTTGILYTFSTLANVGINNINVVFNASTYESKTVKVNYTLESIFGYDHIEYKLYEYNKTKSKYEEVSTNIPNAIVFSENMAFTLDASPGNVYGFAYGKQYKLVISPIGYVDDGHGGQTEINLGSKEKVFNIDDFEEPYVGISASKTNDSIYFRVSIDDTSKVVKDGIYTVKLMDSAYQVLETINDVSVKSINKKFEFTNDDYNLNDNEVYILAITLNADYLNTGNNLTTVTKTKSIRYGNSVSLGAVTASKNNVNDYAIDILFSDSYLLTSIDKISYTVSSTSISYFSTGTSNFNIVYNPNNGIYTFTMPVDANANFKSGNVYTITMNFYSNNTLVEQEEVSYYYTANLASE